MKHIVGIVVIGALAVAGCGGSAKVEASAEPKLTVATTSTTFEDSIVCIQSAESPCPSPSTATIPEEGAKDRARMRAAQSDLRNALIAEKTHYTDAQEYTADVATLSQILPSRGWDTMTVSVDPAKNAVCLSNATELGEVLAIADIASGVNAGTYFGSSECPFELAETKIVEEMGASW
jgi:hypothetical protein